MDNERFDELKDAYVLGALPETERREFEQYLAGHPERQTEVDKLGAVAGLLALSPYEQDPPKQLRRSVMDVVKAEARRPRRVRRRSALASLREYLNVRNLALGAAALLVIGLLSWNVLLQAETRDLQGRVQELRGEVETARAAGAQNPDGSRTITLEGSGMARDVAADVVALEEDRVVLVAENLPTIPEGRTFEVWVIEDDQPKPSGLFEPGGEMVTAPVTSSLKGADAIAVTVEPAGGSMEPTSDPVMLAEL